MSRIERASGGLPGASVIKMVVVQTGERWASRLVLDFRHEWATVWSNGCYGTGNGYATLAAAQAAAERAYVKWRAGWAPTPDTVTPLDQPPPCAAEGDVWATVIPRLPPILRPHAEERRRVGIARYGTPLQARNGRDAMADLLAEALDGIAYAQQAVMERPGDANRETLLWMAIDFAKKVAETTHTSE